MIKKMIALVLAMVMSAGCISASAATFRGADINGDSKINVTDLVRMAAFVKGKAAKTGKVSVSEMLTEPFFNKISFLNSSIP